MPEPFKTLHEKAAPLASDDVDTDQIIPAQFLKVTEKAGLGKYLFYRWRYDEKGTLTGAFVLDQPEFKASRILIAGRNFGIGSSRENAVWALLDAGIRCVIASSFGDIFYNNAAKNGLLCVKLAEETVVSLRAKAARANLNLTIDLQFQVLTNGNDSIHFDIERHIKERLLSGTDDVRLTMSSYDGAISNYEQKMPSHVLPRRQT